MLYSDHIYIAVIGDIRTSKALEDRGQVQDKLYRILEAINCCYENDISAKYLITLGDEFQGLLNNGGNVFEMIEMIEREMYPVRIRFGIGVGTITTSINANMAIGADGPAYYRARNAIEILRAKEKRNKKSACGIWIEGDDSDELITDLLNSVFSLMSVLRNEWTERQREIIYDFDCHGDSQEKTARRLGITQSSVQKGLAGGNYYAYRDARDTAEKVLRGIIKSQQTITPAASSAR